MKKVLFILLIVICIVQPVRTQECTVTETEAAGLAYQTLRLGLADTQSRSLAASAIGTTLGLLPPPTPNMAGSMQLWQLFEGGAGIDPARILEVERYWNEYYAAQQRAADTFANQQRWKTVREEIKTDVGVEVGEGFPQWAINAMNAGGTGHGDISNPYDSVLGRQQSQIRGGGGRWKPVWEEIKTDVGDRIGEGFDGASVAAESLCEIIRTIVENPWKALIIFGVDYEDAEAAGLIGSFMWQMTKEFVKEKAQAVADIIFPNLQIGEPEADMTLTSRFLRIPPPMFGLGRYDSMLLSAQLALEGYGVTAETQAEIDRYFEQYYAAQERAMRNAVKLLP